MPDFFPRVDTLRPRVSPFVTWELTRRCLAQCLNCASDSGPEAATVDDLSTAEALRLVDRLASGGTQVLTLYGGDPLLRPDWQTIVRAAVSRGLAVTVMTNGAVIDSEVADALAESEVGSVSIGLDSHQSEVHDRCRQLPGLFLKAVGAVRRLVDRETRVVIGFRPNRLNAHDLGGVTELAAQLGASAVSVLESVATGRGGRDMSLSDEEMAAVLSQLPDLRHRYKNRLQILLAAPGAVDPGTERPVDCGAGIETTHIDPQGRVTPCRYASAPMAYFRRDGLDAVAGRAEAVHGARLRDGIPGRCSACSLRSCT